MTETVKHTPGGSFKYSMKTPAISMRMEGRIRSPEHSAVVTAALDGQFVDDAKILDAAPGLLAAAKTVLAGLEARIEAAPPEAVPVFDGIAELHAAIANAENPNV